MLFTKKTEYALLALISIAKSKTPKNVDTLSKELNIPKQYLAKILQPFSKKNLLVSYKGANGGFKLNVEPNEISILTISKISEDKIPTVFECSVSLESCPTNQGFSCQIWPVLNKLQVKIDSFLDSLTLEDVL